MYRNELRNFYYDITIKSPDGKRSARLTENLLRQCTKVEITQNAVDVNNPSGSNMLNLTFIEPDYLPDRRDKTPIEGTAGHGYTTNRTGALMDIRFDSEKGFTYVTPSELESGLTTSSRTKSAKQEPVTFLFSSGNKVEVTWGHLEPRTSKTEVYTMATMTYTAGASGNILQIACPVGGQVDLQKLKFSSGKQMVDKTGEPKTLKQLLYDISYIFGARLIFDGVAVTSYPPPTDSYILDRTTQGGDSTVSSNKTPYLFPRLAFLDEQLRELAKQYNSVYEVYEDPIAGNTVIEFNAEKIKYKDPTKELRYRDPDGVVLEVKLDVLDGRIDKTTATSAVDGDKEQAAESYSVIQVTDPADGKGLTFPNSADRYLEKADQILGVGVAGTSVTAPTENKETVSSMSEMETRKKSFMITANIRTLGHPDFKPELINLSGVGVRFSTRYKIVSVKHDLSTAGYFCTHTGMSQSPNEQGVPNEEQVEETKKNDNRQTDVRITEPNNGE